MKKRNQHLQKLQNRIRENRSTLFGWAVLFLMLCLGVCNLQRAVQIGGTAWCEERQEQTGGRISGRIWKIEQTEQRARLFLLGESVIVTLPREKAGEIYPGQWIAASGQIESFAEARNPGQFSMRAYYQAMGYGGQLQAEGWEIRSEQETIKKAVGDAAKKLYCLRGWISRVLEETCEEREAGILQAVLAGEKTALTAEIRDQYQAGGLSHLLSVSGLHVTILCAGAYRLLKKLHIPLSVRCLLSMALTVGYVWMTGASVSALRAGGMFLFTLFAILLGRTYRMSRAALWMAGILLIWRPLQITQAGFQLSFGAIVLQRGMGVLQIEQREKNDWKRQLCARIEGSLLFYVGMAPILAWHQYQISLLSLGMNVLFLPLAEPLLLFGVAGLGLTALLPGWSTLWLFPAEKIAWLLTVACEKVETLGIGVVTTGRPALWQIVLYGGLAVIVLMIRAGLKQNDQKQLQNQSRSRMDITKWLSHWCVSHTARVRRIAHESCILLLVVLPLLLIRLPHGNLQITMLDVGQGDGILTYFADGTTMLTDGGSTDVQNVWRYRIRPTLLEKGIGKLDYVLATHGDEDHCSGIRDLLEEGFPVGALLMANPTESEHLLELAQLAQEKGVAVRILGKGDVWTIGTAAIEVLWPRKDATGLEENERCLVYRLSEENFSMLFTGDISSEIEEEIAVDAPCTVLKVAHHGSKYSTCTEFLEQVQPSLALISSGRNLYGHPSPETEERLEDAGAQIEETVKSGALCLEVKRQQVQFFRFCKES